VTVPYEICPGCHLTTYSARLRLLVDDECPRCGRRLDRAASSREEPPTKRMLGRCRTWFAALPAPGERPHV